MNINLTDEEVEILLESLKYSINYMENKPVPEYYPTYEYREQRITPLKELSMKIKGSKNTR